MDSQSDTTGLPPQIPTDEERLERLRRAAVEIIECMGEDHNREGLAKTPERFAKAIMFLTNGYSLKPEDVVKDAIFEHIGDDMVIVRDIEIYSMCEHHMLPFFGKVHIGYIPNKKVLGLSKLARISEIYSRRLQIQERLTREIAEAINNMIAPSGLGVVVEASHMCMTMRGTQKPGSITTTSCMLGEFRDNPKTREEFLRLISRK
eukprot:TRINITY_DN7207_c0_g1_i1.p2 TRINITY_DN7207_c0_g1~~TRINITY_DN7207_c0_g1_i1.p2  ORF type:complete len:205 (+),score=71.76 TRINITY_DN7207_c0_g1_i1:3-617(+)